MNTIRLTMQAASKVWRFIPRVIRQKLARVFVAHISRRLTISPNPPLPTLKLPRIIVGPFSSNYSFGKVARIFEALCKAAGVETHILDIGHIFPDQTNGGGTGASELEWKVFEKPHHLIVVANGDVFALVLATLNRNHLKNAFISSFWAWERETLPDTWKSATGLCHEIIVPSKFTKDAVKKLIPDATIFVAPHPVEFSNIPEYSTHKIDSGTLTFLNASNLASDAGRKNPVDAIKAYCLAFEEKDGHRLKIHLNNIQSEQEYYQQCKRLADQRPDIILTTGSLSDNTFADWWKDGQVYISLHRSEGFGLGLAEAMYSGRLAIGTGWSGNMEFMSTKTSVCLDYDLVPANELSSKPAKGDKFMSDHWASVSVQTASEVLKNLEANRAQMIALALAGKQAATLKLHKDMTAQALHLK